MPRLVITLPDGETRYWDLRLGTTRVGRHASNDIQVEHLSVSSRHCDLVWMDGALVVRDCDSTNGVLVAGRRVTEARLETGQHLLLGEVELAVESLDAIVRVPELSVQSAKKASVVLPDGTRSCLHHHNRRAAYSCARCNEFFCGPCVRMIRRVGGNYLKFCPSCGGPCDLLPGLQQKKRNWLVNFLHKTLKLKPRP